MGQQSARLLFGGLVACSALLLSHAGLAMEPDEAKSVAQSSLAAARAKVLAGPRFVSATLVTASPEERLAAGDLMLRTGDYERAAHELSKVVELRRQGKVNDATYADAEFLLGEAYFKGKELLSAQRSYRALLEQGQASAFRSYQGRALSRLVDIAWHRSDQSAMDYVSARLNEMPASDDSGSVQYARAKVYFARGDYLSAKGSVGSLAVQSPYLHQAQYLLGVTLAKEAVSSRSQSGSPRAQAPQLAAAIEQFRRVTRLPPDTPEHRHIVDLAWMAIGRLLYETDNYLDAAEAYSHVDRTSPEFSTMLFELSWVWVRLGDFERAQRALEVLAITDPGTLKIADGSLLRADLMLRSGQFERALAAYQGVRDRFDPLRDQVERFLAVTSDPAVYYDKLTAEEFATGGELSPLVLSWAREEAERDNIFLMIDDVSRSRSTLKKGTQLASRLRAILLSKTRSKAFPQVRQALEDTLGGINQVGLARYSLALGMDDVSRDASGELGAVRQERRALMRRVSFLPSTPGDFSRREALGEAQWNEASQRLQQLTLEIDRLRAVINGLRRVMQEGMQGVSEDAASRDRFREEIAANERDLEVYQSRVKAYQQAVDMGRAQIGFGDQRYVEDDEVRLRFRDLFEKEVALVAQGGDQDAARYARDLAPLLSEGRSIELSLERLRSEYESQTEEAASRLLAEVEQEAVRLDEYALNLEGLDQQARLLVGEVAMKNFGLVRNRLKELVLKADVGIVQQAWEVREEQRMRVTSLQRERAREEQNLNDELREVLDDSEEEQ